MKKDFRASGVGVIEIILILVVLIALVVIFKSELTDLVTKAFSGINADAEKLIN